MRILRPAQIYQLRLGKPVTPANLGGDSKSDSSTSTVNDTKNYTDYNDKRNVAQDSAVALSGDNNLVDRSSSSVTQFFDSSNRSSTNLTQFTDNSNRSVTTVNTSTDYGAISSSLAMGGKMTERAFDTTDLAIGGAIDVLKMQTADASKTTSLAFDMAKSSAANSQASSAQVLGFASDMVKQTAAAFENASDNGQSKMVMAALVVVGGVGIAYAFARAR